jgi:hypothetical protein
MNRLLRQFGFVSSISVALLIGTAAPAMAANVISSADDGPGSLRVQVAAAADGEVITIDPGINPLLTSGHILVNHSITIQGQGMSLTSIQGPVFDRAFLIQPSHQVTFQNLEIKGAHAADGTTPAGVGQRGTDGDDGGAISADAGVLTVNSVRFTSDSAGDGGAGGAGLNSAIGGGPGGNGGFGGDGGAIFVGGTGILNVTNSIFDSNRAGNGGAAGRGGNGSGAFANGGEGGAGGTGGYGGAINEGTNGTVTVTNSTFFNNQAGAGVIGGSGGTGSPNGAAGRGGAGGAGGAVEGDAYTILGSTFNANRAGHGGVGGQTGTGPGANGGGGGIGGALSSSETMTVTNSTFFANQTGPGGQSGSTGAGTGGDGGSGGAIASVFATLTNLTIANNVAANSGGGVPGGAPGQGAGVISRSPSGFRLRNSIIANNTATTGVLNRNCAGIIEYGLFNLNYPALDTGCAGSVGDPALGPLQDNGGPTPTMSIAPPSPALDRVPASGFDCPPTDQRGVARPQGTACDLGAFEFAPPTTPPEATPPITTGLRAAALKKCKKKHSRKKRKKCRKKANLLPV